MKNTWISYLNWEKNELWKLDIFSWKIKAHEKFFYLTYELEFEWNLKNWNKRMKNTWILQLN
jgi:hypothetical protein